MRFNPDPNKQAQEVIFSRKMKKIDYPLLYFNQNLLRSSTTHKHLRVVFDTRLDFNLHLQNVQNKVNKTIVILRKLQITLPTTSLITISKILYTTSSWLWRHNLGSSIQHLPSCKYRIKSTQFCISNYGRRKRNFQWKTLSRVMLWIPSTKTLV